MQLFYKLYIGCTGYSISAQDYVLSLRETHPELNIRVDYLNIDSKTGVSENRHQLFESLKQKKLEDDYAILHHSIPIRYRRSPGPQKHIGFCVYETLDPPKQWVDKMNEMDLVITASEFNKNVFKTAGVKKPLKVVPHCFDEKLFNKNVTHKGRYDQFTFFAMGTFKERKNFIGIIEGFYEAFSDRDNVCLLIKTDKPQHLGPAVIEIKRRSKWKSKNTASIYTDDSKYCPFEDVPRIMKKADIYVSTSLGEGFNLVGLHAMALGIPVITTRFGGCLEYAKPNLCTYIQPSEYKRRPHMDGIGQFQNRIWPVIKTQEIAEKLWYVYNNKEQIKKKANWAYDFVHKTFNYSTIGNKLFDSLELQ